MACKLQSLSGGDFACDVSMGGLKKVWIANYDDVSAVTYTYENSADTSSTKVEIASIVMETGKKFYPYTFKRNTANFVTTLNVAPENASNYKTTVITLQFGRMDTTKRLEVAALSLNDLVVICEDNNSNRWYFGITTPVSANGGSGQSGTAMADANMYQIQLEANELEWPLPLAGNVEIPVE